MARVLKPNSKSVGTANFLKDQGVYTNVKPITEMFEKEDIQKSFSGSMALTMHQVTSSTSLSGSVSVTALSGINKSAFKPLSRVPDWLLTGLNNNTGSTMFLYSDVSSSRAGAISGSCVVVGQKLYNIEDSPLSPWEENFILVDELFRWNFAAKTAKYYSHASEANFHASGGLVTKSINDAFSSSAD